MKRPATKILVAAVLVGAGMIGLSAARVAMRRQVALEGGPPGEALPCGPGFFRRGTRCCPTEEPAEPGRCGAGPAPSCPPPLVATPAGCDTPPRSVVLVPATSVLIGPSDWEAEGRVKPRTVRAGPFEIDRFEVSVGHTRCAGCPGGVITKLGPWDAARAASNVSRDEARAICALAGGRLPTEDEWIVAAAGSGPRRYPWGDTGAVCRRAAWGLTQGPCANGATGPDTAGAHPDGVTPLGVHDLAGNVAEWVETGPCLDAGAGGAPCLGVVRGGSFETDLATELRTWVRREIPADSREASIGFRCAYDVGVPSRVP